MPGKKMASIRDDDAYEAMRRKGYSKTKAAKIVNSGAAKKKTGRKK